MNYQELIDSTQGMRSKLLLIMGQQGLSYKKLSRDMGMSTGTIFKFIKGLEPTPQIKTLFKIKSYIEKKGI